MRKAPRSTHDRLLDIQDAIAKARSIARNMTLEAFSQDWPIQFATERALEIISEASRHIPDELKTASPATPWRDIADIGNILRHVYDKTDPEVVWRVVQFDLDPLQEAVAIMLASLPQDRDP